MSDFVDEIADLLTEHVDFWERTQIAQAIIDLIIARIPPLVWVRGGDRPSDLRSQGKTHWFHIYENAQDEWTLDDGESVSSHPSVEDAKAAAQAHHVAQLCKGMGIE